SQQAERVRDRAAVPADAPGKLLLRPAELAEELFVGLGLIDRIQVFAEQVLDERKLEAFGIGRVADDRRDALESGLSSGAPAAFASDELIADASAPDDDRLDHTRRSDRRDQLLQGFRTKGFPGLIGVRLNLVNRDLDQDVVCLRCRRKESAEAAAESSPSHV